MYVCGALLDVRRFIFWVVPQRRWRYKCYDETQQDRADTCPHAEIFLRHVAHLSERRTRRAALPGDTRGPQSWFYAQRGREAGARSEVRRGGKKGGGEWRGGGGGRGTRGRRRRRGGGAGGAARTGGA